MSPALNTQHYRAIALLRRGALVRIGGEWRFGATSVGDGVIETLIASRKATRLFPGQTGDCIVLLDRSRGAGRPRRRDQTERLMLKPYTAREVAKAIGISLDTLYRTRQARHDRDRLPRPISETGPLKFERSGFDAWLTRHHPARPPQPANDMAASPAPASIEESRACLAIAYAPQRPVPPLDARRHRARD